MSETERKFKEALFFFNKLVQSKKDNEKFSFYLSAFLSSARSVTWIMRKEFSKISGWESWWKSKVPTESQGKLIKLFTALRNKSEKEEIIKTGVQIEVRFKPGDKIKEKLVEEYIECPAIYHTEIIKDEVSKKLKMTLKKISSDKSLTIDNISIEQLERIFPESTYELNSSFKVIESCDQYLSILKQLVEECLNSFSNKSNK
jgi:hypothetical protein